MRALLFAALLLSTRAAALASDDERLPGWQGEVDRDGAAGDDPRPRWIEPISWQPRAFLYHNFLSLEECEHVKSVARPRMERSMVVDPDTGGEKLDDIRTSWGTFLARSETPTIAAIERRVAEWSQVPETHQEQLQILRYGLGQKYSDHWDWFDHKTLDVDPAKNSQRVATVLMFLSEVEEGGETVFPLKSEWANKEAAAAANFTECARRGPAIKPRTGDAILFWSMTLTGVEDEASMHASCPVVRGEKWTATKWLHTDVFKTTDTVANTCEDHVEGCADWADGGECAANPGFMLGHFGRDGACVRACCLPQRRDGVPAAECDVCATK